MLLEDCYALKEVNIPSTVKKINDHAFGRCESLSSVLLPNSLTGIGNLCFRGCTSLTNVMLPANLIWIGASAFEGCDNLMNIHVADGNNSYCSVDGVVFNKDMTVLHAFPAGRAEA